MGKIVYNNISSEELGLVIQTAPSYEFPERDIESYHVPGRTGNVVVELDSYKNVTRTYSMACVYKPGTTFVQNANTIVNFINSSKGYNKLEDSYEPDYYRMARIIQGGSLPNVYDEVTVFSLSFDCKPQRWLKIGDEEITVDSINGYTVENPTNYVSKPRFIVRGYGNFKIFQNGNLINTVTIAQDSELLNNDLIIDSEAKECLKNSKNKNGLVSTTDKEYPVFPQGKIKVENMTPNTLTVLKVIPRWWTL